MPRAGSCLSFARAGFAAARFPVAVRLVSLTRSRRVSSNAECGSCNGNPPGHSAVSRSLESREANVTGCSSSVSDRGGSRYCGPKSARNRPLAIPDRPKNLPIHGDARRKTCQACLHSMISSKPLTRKENICTWGQLIPLSAS